MPTPTPTLLGEDPMVLFQGKRGAQRVRLEMAVACSAATGAAVPARTVDLSTTGALLRLVDPTVLGISPGAGLSELAARIAMRFPGGMLLRFEGGLEDLRARVVRVSRPSPPDSGVLLGVRFERALSATDATRLGLPTAPDPGSPAALAAAGAASGAAAQGTGPPSPPPLEGGLSIQRDDLRPRSAGISIVGAHAAPPPPPHPLPSLHSFPPPPPPPPSPRGIAIPVWAAGDPPSPPGPGACPGDVLVYLFPSHAVAPTARVRARNLWGEGLDLVAEIALPVEETDPIGIGAFLGEQPRLVLVKDGHIAYDAPVRVERMVAEAGGVLRLLLKAERALPVEIAPVRRGPQPADVRARQVNRV